jgi:hypothetical protein
LLLIAAVATFGQAKEGRWPSKQRLRSPNGEYEIFCPGKPGSEDFHLILRRLKGKSESEIYHFDRYLTALWSPDSTTLALTDHLGSNVAESMIIDISAPQNQLSIDSLIFKTFPDDIWNIHYYVIGRRWLSPTVLEVGAEGHSDQPGLPTEFKIIYQVTTGGEIKRTSRMHRPPGEMKFTSFSEPCPK